MFFVHRVTDTVAVPPTELGSPAIRAVEAEIDARYPGRVWMDIGLIVARHHAASAAVRTRDDDDGASTRIRGPGVCVAGEAASHYAVTFGLVVFRPFLEEVCVGRIVASTPEGVKVSLGFFDQIYVPAYWMLRPTSYEEATGLWVWTPEYEQDPDDDDDGSDHRTDTRTEEEESTRYEMELGSTIRFKVKSIQFAHVTQTAKGRHATLNRQSSSSGGGDATTVGRGRRRRSSSVGLQLDDHQTAPPPMKIWASICEDGLGLVSWWEAVQEDDDDENEAEEDDDEIVADQDGARESDEEAQGQKQHDNVKKEIKEETSS